MPLDPSKSWAELASDRNAFRNKLRKKKRDYQCKILPEGSFPVTATMPARKWEEKINGNYIFSKDFDQLISRASDEVLAHVTGIYSFNYFYRQIAIVFDCKQWYDVFVTQTKFPLIPHDNFVPGLGGRFPAPLLASVLCVYNFSAPFSRSECKNKRDILAQRFEDHIRAQCKIANVNILSASWNYDPSGKPYLRFDCSRELLPAELDVIESVGDSFTNSRCSATGIFGSPTFRCMHCQSNSHMHWECVESQSCYYIIQTNQSLSTEKLIDFQLNVKAESVCTGIPGEVPFFEEKSIYSFFYSNPVIFDENKDRFEALYEHYGGYNLEICEKSRIKNICAECGCFRSSTKHLQYCTQVEHGAKVTDVRNYLRDKGLRNRMDVDAKGSEAPSINLDNIEILKEKDMELDDSDTDGTEAVVDKIKVAEPERAVERARPILPGAVKILPRTVGKKREKSVRFTSELEQDEQSVAATDEKIASGVDSHVAGKSDIFSDKVANTQLDDPPDFSAACDPTARYPTDLSDIEDELSFARYLHESGLRVHSRMISARKADEMLARIEALGDFQKQGRYEELIFGDTAHFPKLGITHSGSFREAKPWPILLERTAEYCARPISSREFPITPNLTFVNRYADADSGMGFHADQEPETLSTFGNRRGVPYTLILALGGHDVVFRTPGRDISCRIPLSSGDALFIPPVLNVGPGSVLHSKQGGPSKTHFSLVFKSCGIISPLDSLDEEI